MVRLKPFFSDILIDKRSLLLYIMDIAIGFVDGGELDPTDCKQPSGFFLVLESTI